MSTKPFSLQSPEQIAKDYGGNKQKIAQAAQMGLVDSTAAVLAGMFIDRMRSAQMLEQQPQQTVAQQVLSPQPQAAPPPAPPQGGAPMGMAGAPPVGGMQQGGTPVPPPQAAGPGFAEGGLASLPVPDSMFDEPSGGGFNEGYAGGGIVAFAGGGEVYRMGDGYVYADGSPAPAPEPGSTVRRGAQRLIGSGVVDSGESFDVPIVPPYARPDKPGREYSAPIAPSYARPDRPEDPPLRPARKVFSPAPGLRPRTERDYKPGERIPFGDSLVGRGLGAVSDTIFGSPEARAAANRARQEYESSAGAANRYQRALGDYEARSALVPLLGGDVPIRPKPRPLPTGQTPAPKVAPAPRPAPARPAAGAPARPAAGAPVALPASRVGAPVPAAPRVGVPSAPRGGVAPAGPALAASPASPASPAATAAPGVPGAPRTLGGVPADVAAIMAQGREMAPQSTAATDAMRDYYQRMSSPEALAAQKKQDMWATLAQIGFGMAGSNSPSFLQAAGQSASAALPGMMQANRDRKAQEAASVRGMYDIETATNKASADLYQYAQRLAIDVDRGIISQAQADAEIALRREALDEQIRSNKAGEAITRGRITASGSGSGRTPKETDSRYWARRRVEANAGDPEAKAEVAAYDQGRSRGGGNPYQRGAAPTASSAPAGVVIKRIN